MKYIAAYLLATLGGNAHPTKDNVKAILASAGVQSKDEDIDAVISKVGTKSVEEMIKDGSSKISAVGPASAPAAASAAPAKEAAKPEKEEKEEAAAPLALDDMFG